MNIGNVRAGIEAAALRAGRDAGDICIVAVTKTVSCEIARAAVTAGLYDLGENRPQELVRKFDALAAAGVDCRFHQIGTLQRNKVKFVLGRSALIHSVNSVRLASQIDRLASERNLCAKALIQVNVSGEESKQGFSPAELDVCLPDLLKFEHISWRGLMTMAPLAADREEVRRCFAGTRDLFLRWRKKHKIDSFTELSMGMSQDYEIAVEEGATIVRIGSMLFQGLSGEGR